MNKKRKRLSWRKLTPEKKALIHRNQRCRSARLRIEKWLTDQGIDFEKSRDGKKMYRTFLESLGVYRHGITIKSQIASLYTDPNHDIIGPCKDSGFYSCPEWLMLRYEVLRHYGNVCMRCGSTTNIVVDHIKPRSVHPEFELDRNNMQVLCNACNLKKSNKHETDYRPAGSSMPIVETFALC